MLDASAELREHDIKVTPQRVWVHKVLSATSGHLSVDDVFRKVKKHVPAISRATVYAIIQMLKEKGMIREVIIDFTHASYEARRDPHHHFNCTVCHKILDVDIHPCQTIQCRMVDGHEIHDFHGYFYGICKECLLKKK